MIKATGILTVIVTATLCLSAYSYTKPKQYQFSYPAYFGNNIVLPGDNPATEQGVLLGRMLFYEPALSANNKLSCSSCHQQSLAFTDGKRFSDGFDGVKQPRNTMALENLLWVRHFFWDGRATGLEEQAITPMTGLHEMGQSLQASAVKLLRKKIYRQSFRDAFGDDTITGDRIIKALAQFERTLISCNAPYDQYLRGDYKPTNEESHGIDLFFGNAGCGHCHGGPKTFIELYHNNGLDSVFTDAGRQAITGQSIDKGRFRVVSLRNIFLTAPYMHDGRFTTLNEVLDQYNEHVAFSSTLSPFLKELSNQQAPQRLRLSIQDKNDLLAFLRMLTDSTFITDKRFSNPFNL